MRMATTSIRLSAADKRTLEIAARKTGRSVTEYIREVAVLCAIRYITESGDASRLPAEHRGLFERELEAVAVQDVVGVEAQRSRGKSKAA